MKTSEKFIQIIKSLAGVQSQLKGVEMDGFNPHHKAKYQSIHAIWDCIRQPLVDNDLILLQDITNDVGTVSVLTKVYHTSGEWMEFGPLTLSPARPTDPQCVGACITYAKKYAICAALGLVRESDDDANSAIPKSSDVRRESKLDNASILKIEQELAGYDDLRTKILEGFKVKEFSEIDQRMLTAILKRVRECKEAE